MQNLKFKNLLLIYHFTFLISLDHLCLVVLFAVDNLFSLRRISGFKFMGTELIAVKMSNSVLLNYK